MLAEMQKAADGDQSIQSRSKRLLNRNRQNRIVARPYVILLKRRQQREPANHVVIPQPARPVLHIRLQMKYRAAEFAMPRTRQLAQALDDLLGLARQQFRNHFIMQSSK